MSASENSRPANDLTEYEINEKTDCGKHKPKKYLIPASFINPGPLSFDRQYFNLSDDQEMPSAPNSNSQVVNDNIEPYRTYDRYNDFKEDNPYKNNEIYNNNYIGNNTLGGEKVREGFCSSKDDKLLDIALSIIIGILLIYIIYKFIICKPIKSTNEIMTTQNIIPNENQE